MRKEDRARCDTPSSQSKENAPTQRDVMDACNKEELPSAATKGDRARNRGPSVTERRKKKRRKRREKEEKELKEEENREK